MAFEPHMPPPAPARFAGPALRPAAPARPPAGSEKAAPDAAPDRGHGPAAMVSIDESNVRVAQAAHLYQTQASAALAHAAGREAMAAIGEIAALADRAAAGRVPADRAAGLAGALAEQRARLDGAVREAEFGGSNLLAAGRHVRTVTNLSGLSFEVRGHPLDSASLGLSGLDLSTPEAARDAAQAARRARAIVAESVAVFDGEAEIARLQRESIREMAITLDAGLTGAIAEDPGEPEARAMASVAAGLIGAGSEPIFSRTADAMDILEDAVA